MSGLRGRASGILIVAILVTGSYLLGWSDFFSVKSVAIEANDPKIAGELRAQLEAPPRVIEIGEPIARVDKREITARLRELIWVDGVTIRRNLITGVVAISVEPRSAIGRLAPPVGPNAPVEPISSGEIRFLGADLESFALPQSAVDRAARAGRVDWRDLPTIALSSDNRELRADVATILAKIEELGGSSRSITAENEERISSVIELDGRNLDISWGNVKELELKSQVLLRLVAMKENRKAVRIDLSAPLSPVVSNR